MKDPVEVPSFVVEFEVVGVDGETTQQTPRLVRGPPPLFVTFPPLTADDGVIDEMVEVVTVGTFTVPYGISDDKSIAFLIANLGYFPNPFDKMLLNPVLM